ncbi:unnamed protein product [Lactuca saligna]|uniref:Uncharacterized protein n=1 Tax=Lactuca saligna TaxID=75948 RepID=A0AA35ZGT0_LACSI|nr:unnamed protein product [Lactuca saligna]
MIVIGKAWGGNESSKGYLSSSCASSVSEEGVKVRNQKAASASDVCSGETLTSVVGLGQGTKKKWRMKGGKAKAISTVFKGVGGGGGEFSDYDRHVERVEQQGVVASKSRWNWPSPEGEDMRIRRGSCLLFFLMAITKLNEKKGVWSWFISSKLWV